MIFTFIMCSMDFPGSSAGKESACNTGDPGSVPGLGRSREEGIGYAFQYSWASLVAHMVKNLPAVWETWVWSLGWEYPLEEGMGNHSSILAWRIITDKGLQTWAASPWDGRVGQTEWLSTHVQYVLMVSNLILLKKKWWLKSSKLT